MKRVTLEIQYADKRIEMRQLSDGTYIIGRDSGHIALHNTIVSGRHGEIKIEGTNVIYTDQGSTNGTFTADGNKITAPLQMTQGMILRIGECQITLKAIHQPAAATVLQPAIGKNDLAMGKTTLGQPPVNFAQISSPPPAAAAVAASAAPAPQAGVAPIATAAQVANVPAPVPDATAAPLTDSADVANAPSLHPGPVEVTAAGNTVPAPPIAPSTDAIIATDATDNSQNASGSTTNDGQFSYKLDVGAMINTPMKDEGWLMKCLMMGLFALIPIAGGLNLMGWLVACYQNRKQGSDEIPPANLSYIGAGIPLLLAYLPILGAYIAVAIVFGIITWILPFLFFIAPLLYLAIGLYAFVAGPAIMYLTIEGNVSFASIRINEILAFAKSNTQGYTNLIIAFLIAGAIGGAGGIIGIGTILTIPFATVIQANILGDIR